MALLSNSTDKIFRAARNTESAYQKRVAVLDVFDSLFRRVEYLLRYSEVPSSERVYEIKSVAEL